MGGLLPPPAANRAAVAMGTSPRILPPFPETTNGIRDAGRGEQYAESNICRCSDDTFRVSTRTLMDGNFTCNKRVNIREMSFCAYMYASGRSIYC